MENTFERIFKETQDEIDRQDEKWGKGRSQHPSVWLTILTEETGEIAEEICNAGFEPDKLSENYEVEIIQSMGVLAQMLKDHRSQKY